MKRGFVKVIECFNITGIGVLIELQHYENGIPPDTEIIDLNSETKWVITKRVLSGKLLNINSEIIFDCETKYEHLSYSFKTQKDQKIAISKELERRKNRIYWYFIKPMNNTQEFKPKVGSELKIIL